MIPFWRYFGKRRFPHWGFAIIIALWCLVSSGWATNTYHTNRVFNKVTFTIPGVPTAFEVCNMAGQLTTVVGPTNVNTNNYFVTEYQSVVVEHGSSAQAWAAAVAGYPSNSMVHANYFYDNVGWVKGLKQTRDGKWGGYIWAMQNTVNFKTSATNVWVSATGVTNSISKVLVGTIGDYAAMETVEDTGPGIGELTNWPGGASNDMSYTADFTAYYDINLPYVSIVPKLTNVCINSGNVTFTLGGASRVTNGVTWSITPEGVSNGATLTGYASNAVVNVGSVATTYVVRATANENTNIFGSAILNVVKAGLPFKYKIGTNVWAEMPEPLYVCKDTTVSFKAMKVPTNASWPSGKPVWGGLVSGAGVETNSYTFSTLSTNDTDYKIVTAECGNTVTGKVLVGGIRKIPLGGSTNLVKGIIGKVYIPTKWGGSNTLFGSHVQLFYTDGADLDFQSAIKIANGEMDGQRVAQGNPCVYEVPAAKFGWYYVKITDASEQTINSIFDEHGEVARPWQGYYWPTDPDTDPNLFDDGYALDKYDQVYGTTSQVWEATYHVGYTSWEGHCWGTVVASVLTNQPAATTSTNNVSFSQEDMEGLYIELADSVATNYVAYSVTNIPVSPVSAETGEAIDSYCDDFHNVLASVLIDQNDPLVGNLRDSSGQDDSQVWNHAVYKYRSEMRQAPDQDNEKVIRVYTVIWSPLTGIYPSSGIQDRIDTYSYEMKYDTSGKIDGNYLGQNWRTASGFPPRDLYRLQSSAWTARNPEVTLDKVKDLY